MNWLYPPADWLNPAEDKETDPLADTTTSYGFAILYSLHRPLQSLIGNKW